ncbi:MAG: GNAT family N-acetyltransferase [Candidatus Sifarchaeia archaeon]
MPKPFSIVRAQQSDYQNIISLLEHVKVPTNGINFSFTRFLVIRFHDEDIIGGCIGLELYGTNALLRSFAIHPKYQGSGLGRILVQKLLEVAAQNDVNDVFLLTTKADSMFRKFGFSETQCSTIPKEIGENDLFRIAGLPTARCMVKRGIVQDETSFFR